MQDDERRPLARFGVSQYQGHVRVFVRSGLLVSCSSLLAAVQSRGFTIGKHHEHCEGSGRAAHIPFQTAGRVTRRNVGPEKRTWKGVDGYRFVPT